MLYIIGLGLNERGISKQGLLALEKCHKIYLEGYTVDFPYDIENLYLGKKIKILSRGDVESDKLIKEAKGRNIALLVYGSPLFATTHMSLVLEAAKAGIKTKIIHAASIFDAIAETGLQLYKFGKIASMPNDDKESKNNKEKSDFLKYVKENQSINAHSLILIDIGMKLEDALDKIERQAKKEKIKIDKIIVCSKMGTKRAKILYSKIKNLKKAKIKNPFCFILPSNLHFLEKDGIERFKN